MFGFGKKDSFKVGDYIFTSINEGDYNSVVVGVVESRSGDKLMVTGLNIKPIGLIQKVKAGSKNPRYMEVLKSPTPDNMIHALIDKVETSDFHDDIDISQSYVKKIGPKRYTEIDSWIREGFPELLSVILSNDQRKDEAKQIFLEKMNAIYDPEMKQMVYAIARQLKII